MQTGVAYYPEQRTKQQREEDFGRIQDAGFQWVRMAEFAWSSMEPEPGRFTFDWLDDAVELASRRRLKVMLGTPTAAPPAWLCYGHPEILPVGNDGRRTGFGARHHRCYNVPAYLEASDRVVRAMAQRYGRHSAVLSWQIDNEIGGEQKRCHCNYCRAAFHEYLRRRYGDVATLNERWWTVFWSQTYGTFADVPLPVAFATDMPQLNHPSLQAAFMRFCSDSMVRYCRRQARLLHEHVAPGVRVLTNTDSFRFGDSLDLCDLFADLDVVGFDLYTNDACEVAFYSDLMTGLKEAPFWMAEYGVNGPYVVRDVPILAEHGCELLQFFKWNAFPGGQEQHVAGMVTPTGRDSANHGRVLAAVREAGVREARMSAARVGMVYDFASSWVQTIARGIRTWDTPPYFSYAMNTVYKAMFERGEAVRFVFRPGAVVDLKVLLMPGHVVHHEVLEDSLLRWVRGGGVAVASADLFQKNADNLWRTALGRLQQELGLADYPEEKAFERPVLGEWPLGAGRMMLVKSDAAGEVWSEAVARALAERGAE